MSRFLPHVIGCTLLLALANRLEVVAGAPPAPPQPVKKDAFVYVEVVKTPVFYRDNPNDKMGKELPPLTARDKPHKFTPGELWVKCGEGGVVHVYRPGQVGEVFGGKNHKDQEGQWHWIRKRDYSERELTDYRGNHPLLGDPGSPERGGGVLSPVEDRLVRPASLVFRWVPEKPGVKVSLTVKETKSGEEVWRKNGINGANGEYWDIDAREALAKWRKKNGVLRQNERSRLQLVYQDDKIKKPVQVPFDVLGTEEEAELENDLRTYDHEVRDLLSLRLARATIFYNYGLLPEAADESLLATKLMPKGYVWDFAVELHKMIGDPRVKEPDKKAP